MINKHLFNSIIISFFGVFFLAAQGHLISGKIVDENGGALPGVTVIEQDTTNGVVSDLDGNYILTTSSANTTLIFSYLGFDTKSIAIDKKRYMDVILEENVESLEEVQVVAFQKQKKNSVIGSINTIKPAELKQP